MIKKFAITFVIFYISFSGWTQSNSCKADPKSCIKEQHALIGSSAYYNGPHGMVELKGAGWSKLEGTDIYICYLHPGTGFKILNVFPSEESVLAQIEEGEKNLSVCKKNDRVFLPEQIIITKNVAVDESIESVDEFSKNQLVYFTGSRPREVRTQRNPVLEWMFGNNKCYLHENAEFKILGFSVDREFVSVEVKSQIEVWTSDCKKNDVLFLSKHDLTL